MAEIINLRRARKQKLRDDKEVTASQNRAKFGLSAHEKSLTSALNKQISKSLDAHFLVPTDKNSK
jgi:Domain of unknown function (DUF4169)